MNLSGVDVVDEPTTPIYDPENLEKCLAFAGKFRAVQLNALLKSWVGVSGAHFSWATSTYPKQF